MKYRQYNYFCELNIKDLNNRLLSQSSREINDDRDGTMSSVHGFLVNIHRFIPH